MEVDHYEDFFVPILKSLGYTGSCYGAKDLAPGNEFGYFTDGVCLFWKESEFEADNINVGSYVQCATATATFEKVPFAIVRLKMKTGEAAGTTIKVATTHLKSKIGVSNEETRRRQIGGVVDKLAEGEESDLYVLCGDCNTDPQQVGNVPALVVPYLVNECGFTSSYDISSNESSWTTWKKRGEKESKHIIDYIFFKQKQKRWGVVRTLDPPEEKDVPVTRLPAINYPSDHIAICCDLSILHF